MIRLIVLFIGLFLLWLWLLSPFGKRAKMLVTALAMIAAIVMVSYETYMGKPRQGLIEPTQILVCNLAVKHQYRSDYRVQLCVQNSAKQTAKRLSFMVNALRCENGDCQTIESVTRDIPLTIVADETLELEQTLRFESVAADDVGVSWTAEITSVKAIP